MKHQARKDEKNDRAEKADKASKVENASKVESASKVERSSKGENASKGDAAENISSSTRQANSSPPPLEGQPMRRQFAQSKLARHQSAQRGHAQGELAQIELKPRHLAQSEFTQNKLAPRQLPLRQLQDQDLLLRTKTLVQGEREILVEMLQHLKEIDSRRLFVKIGYASLWAYCTQELKYSEAAAHRRIAAMRAMREVPSLEKKIQMGNLSLTNVAKAQSALRRAMKKRHGQGVAGAKFEGSVDEGSTAKEKVEVLAKDLAHGNAGTRAKTEAAVETEACKNAEISAKIEARKNTATPANVEIPTNAEAPIESEAFTKLELFSELENKSQKEAERILAGHFSEPTGVREKIRSLNENTSEVRFSVSRELLEKLENVKSLMSHKNPNPSFAELVEIMADFLIAKKDPQAKKNPLVKKNPQTKKDLQAKLEQKYLRKKIKQKYSRSKIGQKELSEQPPLRRFGRACHGARHRRYIRAEVRRSVWRKAGGRCEYTDHQSGRRCNSRHRLEIEHVRPVAFGGSNERENLRLFCRTHNEAAARDATLM